MGPPCDTALPPKAMNRVVGAGPSRGRALAAPQALPTEPMNRERQIQLGLTSQRYAESLRERATPAERRLCEILDTAKISYVFQSNMFDHVSGRIYIADFKIKRVPPVRPKGLPRKTWQRDDRKIFVEVDGGYHAHRQAYDAARTRWIESHRNAVVLRVTNTEVFTEPDKVLAMIESYGPAKRKYKSYTSPYRPKRRRTDCTRNTNTASEKSTPAIAAAQPRLVSNGRLVQSKPLPCSRPPAGTVE